MQSKRDTHSRSGNRRTVDEVFVFVGENSETEETMRLLCGSNSIDSTPLGRVPICEPASVEKMVVIRSDEL